jgi:DNA polymerase elongation subunit (family B)
LYPNSININDYGILIIKNYNHKNKTGKLYQYKSNIQILILDNIENNNLIRECIVFKNKIKVLSYVDIINDNSNFYNRKINNVTLTFNLEGKLINKENLIKCKTITKENKELVQNLKILTFDIECYLNRNNKFIPYACGFTNGIINNLYYLTDYKNSEDMLLDCITNIIKMYNKFTIYVHNFSNFDYYFILKILNNNNNIKFDSFYKDNKLYSLKLSMKVNNKIHSIIFKDSYLLLSNSLRKLGKDFNVETVKGYFLIHL